MRHFFRLNVKGEGYVLYAGPSGKAFVPQSLGSESPEVPRSFLEAQRRIDAAVRGGAPRWSLAVHYPGRGQALVLAFGVRIEAPDEFGRRGLSYIHGVELDGPNQIRSAVVGVLSLVAGRTGEALVQRIESTAVEASVSGLRKFLNSQACSMEAAAEVVVEETQAGESLIASVTHNCGGAAATAWLALADQQAGRDPPWSFFDVVEKDGEVLTLVDPPVGEATSASRLLLQASFAQKSARHSQKPRTRELVIAVVLLCAVAIALWLAAKAKQFKTEADLQAEQAKRFKTEADLHAAQAKRFKTEADLHAAQAEGLKAEVAKARLSSVAEEGASAKGTPKAPIEKEMPQPLPRPTIEQQ